MKRDLGLLETRPLNVKLHMPVPPLRPFIDSIVYCKGHDLGHSFERTLPDGTSQLQIVMGDGGRDVISQSGKQVQSFTKAWVMGMNNIPVTYRLSEVEGLIYVRFKPAGLYAFTKIHQAELNNLVVDARIVFGPSLENLWETLAGCHQAQQMISHVEDFFLRKLQTVVAEPARLTYMLEHIHFPLTELAKKTGYSSKYLTKTFQKHIGVGPKTFQRIQRFHAAVCNLNHLTENVDWAELVFLHGYHDQAHFIKDFKYFSGLSPQNYLALGPTCTRYLHTAHLPEHLF
jgi:AraC-like DNA-binding protein